MELLSIRDLEVNFGNVRALDGVAMQIAENEIVTVVGANGAGKSTLMRAIMGLAPAAKGAIAYQGRSILRMPTHRIARGGIALVPEGRGPLRQLTVKENLVMGAFAYAWDATSKRTFDDIIDRFPVLGTRLSQQAGSLSGGEQQMLVIGRALMSRPKLMLLDEPSLGLAPQMVSRVFSTIASVGAMGVAVLFVEQNAHAALDLANRAYVLENGKVVLEGAGLAGDPRVQEAYLGGAVA
jgi:branched-chain amino acid transport system ATP-binding protein